MRRSISLFVALALAVLGADAMAQKTRYPVLGTKQYPTAQGAATGGGAYAITRAIARRGAMGEFGVFHSRHVKVTQGQDNQFSIQTRKVNPDNKQPIASTALRVVRTRQGNFKFLDPSSVSLNLPITTVHTSKWNAGRAAAAKAILGDAEVTRWFSARMGVEGADVMKKLWASVDSTSASGKSATLSVYTRAKGQDDNPMVQTTVQVRQMKNGQWRAGKVGGLEINDLWE